MYLWSWVVLLTDLRDDKQFFIDHPGSVPITTAQVNMISLLVNVICNWDIFWNVLVKRRKRKNWHCISLKGEELRRSINSPAYIECSSKTQQVLVESTIDFHLTTFNVECLDMKPSFVFYCRMWSQCLIKQ